METQTYCTLSNRGTQQARRLKRTPPLTKAPQAYSEQHLQELRLTIKRTSINEGYKRGCKSLNRMIIKSIVIQDPSGQGPNIYSKQLLQDFNTSYDRDCSHDVVVCLSQCLQQQEGPSCSTYYTCSNTVTCFVNQCV